MLQIIYSSVWWHWCNLSATYPLFRKRLPVNLISSTMHEYFGAQRPRNFKLATTSVLMLNQSLCPKDFDLMVMLSHSVIRFQIRDRLDRSKLHKDKSKGNYFALRQPWAGLYVVDSQCLYHKLLPPFLNSWPFQSGTTEANIQATV